MALDSITGMPSLPITSAARAAIPAAPKGYMGPKEIAPIEEELGFEIVKAKQKVGESDIEIEKAKRQEKADELRARATNLEKFSKDIETMPETKELAEVQKKQEGMEFVPTKDTAQDIAGLFGLIGVIGMVIGKGNAQQAMGAMNGMLEGHRKGRQDLFKQELQQFDKNFKAMQTKVTNALAAYQRALERKKIDKEAGELMAQAALAEAESPLLKAIKDKQGDVAVLERLQEAKKAMTETMPKMINDLQKARDDRADRNERARLDREAREKAAGLKAVGGPRSAINERYANTVYRSANEVLRSLELIEQIGISTGGGALGGVVGKGSIPSEIQRYIGQSMTEEQQKNYNTAMSGLSLELAYVLNGGYKPDVTTTQKIENLLSVGPNDTAGNAAYKFADAAAKLKAAIEVSPAYTEDQKKTRDMLFNKLDKYATPEIVYERAYGIPERREPMVRAGEYPTPQTQAEFDALEPGTEYIDPDDKKIYKKRAK